MIVPVKILKELASRFSSEKHRLTGRVKRALALNRRGGTRGDHDRLQLVSARAILQVEWLARDIHPWDRDLPPDRAEQAFSEQCLRDTDSAIARLFAEFPAVDAVELRVARSASQPVLIAGVVKRHDLVGTGNGREPIAMKLRNLGVVFRMNQLRLEGVED